jgi:hypothetical protein
MQAIAKLLFVSGIAASAVQAAPVPNLYEGEGQIAEKHDAPTAEDAQTALRPVLVKLTGDRTAADSPAAAKLYPNANKYLQGFGYRTDAKGSSLFWGKFEPGLLDSAAHSAGFKLWSKDRPAVLVWLTLEENGQRRLLNPNENSNYIKYLQDNAGVRGLPLLFPLLDLQDEALLKVPDLWEGFKDVIVQSGQRYKADIILAGLITVAGPEQWLTRWTLYAGSDDTPYAWNGNPAKPDAALAEAIDAASDALAQGKIKRKAPDPPMRFELTVQGISSFTDYTRIQHYLASIAAVKQVDIKRMDGERAVFAVSAIGGLETVAEAINLGTTLQPVSADDTHLYRVRGP